VPADAQSTAYLLVGKEIYLKRKFISELRSKLFTDASSRDFNSRDFTARKDSLASFLDHLRSVPFLASKRMAVLWEIDRLLKADQEEMIEALERLPSTACLVLVSDETSIKKSRFLTELSAKVKLVACHTPFEKQLPGWIRAQAGQKSKDIQDKAIFLLIERAGSNLSNLDQALEQLAVFIEPRRTIAYEDVEKLLGKSVEADVFMLMDFIMNDEKPRVFQAVHELLQNGTKAFEIVGVLAGQLQRLHDAAELLRRGVPSAEIGVELRVHTFFLDKFLSQARRLSKEKCEKWLTALLDCDEVIKRGNLNDCLALDHMLLSGF